MQSPINNKDTLDRSSSYYTQNESASNELAVKSKQNVQSTFKAKGHRSRARTATTPYTVNRAIAKHVSNISPTSDFSKITVTNLGGGNYCVDIMKTDSLQDFINKLFPLIEKHLYEDPDAPLEFKLVCSKTKTCIYDSNRQGDFPLEEPLLSSLKGSTNLAMIFYHITIGKKIGQLSIGPSLDQSVASLSLSTPKK